MKTKQIIGIIVTGIVIIAVGVTGVLSNVLQNKYAAEENNVFSELWEMTEEEMTLPEEEFVGLIHVVGEIGPSSYEAYYSEESYNHDLYMDYVDEMMLADNNKGIMLYVDSPGGTVSAFVGHI